MVDDKEYNAHKEKCSKSFEEIFAKLEKLDNIDLAMFGNKEAKVMGVLDMTKEMYKTMNLSKGGQHAFWAFVRIAGGVSIIIGSFWAVYEFLKKITIN